MLQLFCMLSMLLDHIGFKFDIQWLRLIGRFAMPIYAYFIVMGFHKTHNLKKYVFRIIGIAALAQLPYMMLTGYTNLNICFSWLLGLIYLYAKSKCIKLRVLLFLPALFLPFEYSIISLLWIVFFELYYYPVKRFDTVLACFILLCGVTGLSIGLYGFSQVISIMAVPVIELCRMNEVERLPDKYKGFFRVFYPTHLFILYLCR